MAERFYIKCTLEPGLVLLQGPEAHHLATVSRVRTGDEIFLFNGDGYQYVAHVLRASRNAVELEVIGRQNPETELSFELVVAAPIPKGDRAQFMVEKLTELGVSTYVPLTTQRSIIHPREAKMEKLRRYVVEASKQCGRNVLMNVANLTAWESFAVCENKDSWMLLAHPGADGTTQFEGLPAECCSAPLIVVAVGPEGGFTDGEIELARRSGWHCTALGPRTLRVETAALVLAAIIIAFHK